MSQCIDFIDAQPPSSRGYVKGGVARILSLQLSRLHIYRLAKIFLADYLRCIADYVVISRNRGALIFDI